MALSLRVKNLLFGGSLAVFAGSVFAYTMHQMSKDDFDDLDQIAKVNVHQSGTMKATPVKKD
uniref:Cytochrome c oxidase assembly factor 3 mitochondrial coiled-coil domain-containing protein n=1 Tax=Globisporangium ultimum (strain ATCC 200006 / CBS 805.95 / DAOM BR144) TaxID=431595 RepID=K3WXW3_GLOUD